MGEQDRLAHRGGTQTRDLLAARSLIGARFTETAFDSVRVDARMYWAHELADTAALIRSDLFGVGFTTRTNRAGRDGAVMGLGVSGVVAPGARPAASYAGEVRPGATAHSFTAGLAVGW